MFKLNHIFRVLTCWNPFFPSDGSIVNFSLVSTPANKQTPGQTRLEPALGGYHCTCQHTKDKHKMMHKTSIIYLLYFTMYVWMV